MNLMTPTHTKTMQIVTCAALEAMEFPPLSREPARVPTWRELVEVEPELIDVERMATGYRRTGRNEWRSWSEIKRAFLPLVGFTARHYELRNSTCYEVVYDHLLACWEGRKHG
jgi:hypothetical protein